MRTRTTSTSVTVQADDGAATETVAVAVTVTDIDEPGVVTLSPLKPKLGAALTAKLADPDPVTGTTTWLWERNKGREGWETIDGATSASYTPTAADGDRYLRATATCADGFGGSKTAQAMAPHAVIAYRLRSLSFTGLTGVAAPASAQTVITDKAALVALYTATNGAKWTTNTKWSTNEPLASWHGVTTNSDGRVTELDLNGNGLDGTLPAELGDLSELEQLDLGSNDLSGALPTELANLSNLTTLLLNKSRALTGPLPDGLRELTDLTTVWIQDTELCAPDDDAFQMWVATLPSFDANSGNGFGGLICPPAEQSVIDVAVFYTPAGRDYLGGTQAIRAKIDSMVAETNMAYRDSGVNQRIALVAVAETAYTKGNIHQDLSRLDSKTDGYMDEVHAIRDHVAADIVMLIRRTAGFTSGVAAVMVPASLAFERYAFGVIGVNSGLTRTFAHELGHLMGLLHNRASSCCPTKAFPYAYGYM